MTNETSPDTKTVALGLKETYNMDNEEISEYLIGKNAIKGNFTKDNLISIIKSANSSNSGHTAR